MNAKPQASASSPATTTALKMTQIGNSVGVILPKDVLARLKVGKGDSLFVTEVPDWVRHRPQPHVRGRQQAHGLCGR